MIAIQTDRRWSKLRESIRWSREQMRPYREHRTDAIKQYVGTHYSDSGPSARVPVNLLSLMVNVMLRQVAARRPQVTVSTPFTELMSAAWDLELAVNACLELVNFETTIRAVALEALFSQGVMKIALFEDGDAEVYGQKFQGYHPFASNIELDNWVIDMSATEWDNARYIGDSYLLPYDYIQESDRFDKRVKDRLSTTPLKAYNENGDERAQSIGVDIGTAYDDLRPMVRCWDIYIPREQLVVVMAEDHEGSPLSVHEWTGPYCGPYHRLGYIDVPGNLMKMGPVGLVKDLQKIGNQLYTKLVDDGMDEKTILAAAAEAMEDAKAIMSAGNGAVLRIDNPDKIKEFTYRGINNVALAFALEVFNRFNYMAGNMESYGGLSVQADTARQEELVNHSASAQLRAMQDATVVFTRQATEAIADLIWNDPLIEMPICRRLPMMPEIAQASVWTAESRRGEFRHYNIAVNPYSMRDQTPEQQLAELMELIGQVYQPYMAVAQAQGTTLDFAKLAEIYAKLRNSDYIKQVFRFDGPPSDIGRSMVGEAPEKPSVTRRITERINRPGASARGKHEAMMQLLLGSKLQNAQRSTISTPVG